MHDAHHEKFNVNFGGMGWLDSLYGTGQKITEAKKEA